MTPPSGPDIVERRDYLQEAMAAMADLSLPDIEALRAAAKLLQKSRATDINKAFALGFSMDLRSAAKRKSQQDATLYRTENGR